MKYVNNCVFLFIAAVVTAANGNRFSYPCPTIPSNNKSDDKNDCGPGEPLFLTPMMNNQSLSMLDIQTVARVTDPRFLGVDSYSGYLTVDEKFNSNLFFWYFPAEEDCVHAPVVLWLQGGPGASSMIGLFTEVGPLQLISENKLIKRKYAWSKNHNLIFIDSPVGSGFSFTEDDKGYARNDSDVARNLYEAVIQLYKLFEWSDSSSFWIAGESYAGKYVPALAYHIHKEQHKSMDCKGVKIPLKGLVIGNGLSDPVNQLQYGDYFYQLGLIDDNGLQQFHLAEAVAVECINNNDMNAAFELFDLLILGNSPKGSLFKKLTGFDWYYNFMQAENDDTLKKLDHFVQLRDTRNAIHVGNRTYHNMDKNNKVKLLLKQDFMRSVVPWIEELLEFYTVCMYSGQLDVILPYPLTRNFLKHLNFSSSDEFTVAQRKLWRVDGHLAGYVKEAGNLIEILVRNAGHMAPSDQPKWMYELIYHLTHYHSEEKYNF